MARACITALALLVTSGCFYEPCDDYVDYLCTCHEDDPQYDCESLEVMYLDADPELQDQCAVDLAAVQSVDEEAGLQCAW
jgi:hypothetical protein